MQRGARWTLLAAWLASPPSAVSAQSITGLVLDDGTRAPLVATVRLAGRNDRALAEVHTDSTGLFYLTAPGAGEYHLIVRRSEGGEFRGRTFALAADSALQRSIAVPLLRSELRAGPFADEVTKPAAPRPHNPGPRYPTGARERLQRGMVMAFFVVKPDGRADVSTAQLIATSADFSAAVRDALKVMRFFPGERDGNPIAQVMQLSFGFGFMSEPVDGDVAVHASRP